jgi:glycine/sarcosine N-methyltransferase
MNPSEHNSPDFYAALGDDYDQMTRDSMRWAKDVEHYRSLLNSLSPKHILDAGCGTGGEALFLAELGYQVMGIDSSADFIEIARKKAADRELRVEFQADDLLSLSSIRDDAIDLLICRGNTLPHIQSSDDLSNVFKSFYRVVKPNGFILIQWLNYTHIIKEKKRLIGATGNESQVFLRFYDFTGEDELIFNIITLNRTDQWRSDWISTRLHPWRCDEVSSLAEQSSWKIKEIAADMNHTEFKPDQSKDIVMLAFK